jgi:hypothetical protein
MTTRLHTGDAVVDLTRALVAQQGRPKTIGLHIPLAIRDCWQWRADVRRTSVDGCFDCLHRLFAFTYHEFESAPTVLKIRHEHGCAAGITGSWLAGTTIFSRIITALGMNQRDAVVEISD